LQINKSEKGLMLWVLLQLIFPAFSMGFGSGYSPPTCPTLEQRREMDRRAVVSAAMESSPFRTVCDKLEYFKNIPEGNLLGFGYPVQDEAGLSQKKGHRRKAELRQRAPRHTRELMMDMHKHIIQKLQEDINVAENLIHCQNSAAGSPDKNYCDQVGASEMLENEIPNQSQQARFNLALSTSSFGGSVETLVTNGNLNSPREVYKAQNWNPLSKEDRSIVNEVLDSYKARIRSHLPDDPNAYYQLMTELKDRRLDHLAAYDMIMNRFPVLHFIQDGLTARPYLNPANQSQWTAAQKEEWAAYRAGQAKISTALRKTIEMRREQIVKLNEMRIQLRTSTNDEVLSGSVDVLEDWGPHVHGYLREHPEDCGLATALAFRKTKRAIGTAAAIIVPFIGASIFLPPLAAAAGGTAAGVATTVGLATLGTGMAVYGNELAADNLESAQLRATGASITGLDRDINGAFTFDEMKVAQIEGYSESVFRARFHKDMAVAMIGFGAVAPATAPFVAAKAAQVTGVVLRSSSRIAHSTLKLARSKFSQNGAAAASP
jgi:hypothetical protein